MTSLYTGAPAEDLASPLLGTARGNNGAALNYEAGRAPHGHRHHDGGHDDDAKAPSCCPQWLKSLLAVLLALGGIASSIWAILATPVQPLAASVIVYVMAGVCLLTSVVVTKNERIFLFQLPASRAEVLELMAARRYLEGEANAHEDAVENLERTVARRRRDEATLRGIVEGQSSSVGELAGLVRENEEALDRIREHLRQKVMVDVVGVLANNVHGAEVIDNAKAAVLAEKVKAKMEGHGVIFDEEKFLHAVAINATLVGAMGVVKRLILTDKLGGDDVFDMFHLPSNDRRQLGSVDAARAIKAGKPHVSIAPVRKMGREHRNEGEWDDGSLADDGIPKKHKNRLREQLYQFRMMAFPYFRETGEGKCLFGTLVVLSLVNSGISVYFSYLIRDFWTALSDKDVHTFYTVMGKFVVSMIVLIPLQVSFRFIRVKLGIAWRRWLTERVLQLYFANKVYYGLERQSKAAGASAREYKDRKKEMDNPDQRIQEDVNAFTEFSLSFFLTIVTTVIDLVSFSIILISILPELFIAIIVFAGLGTIFSVLIGKVLIKLNYESLQREADFRFSLVRIRENAESIAFYKGEKVEKRQTKQKFGLVIDNMTQINWATLRLDTFTTTYNHLVNILPIFILANQYFHGLIEFGVIAQARQAFWHILDDLSVIIDQFTGIAAFMAGIDRLFLFMKAIQELDADRPNDDSTVIVLEEHEKGPPPPAEGIAVKEYGYGTGPSSPRHVLTIRNLQLMTPDHKRVLIENLNLSLSKGQNLLIAGVSGAGKSSLLRAIAGLWLSGEGEITRSKDVYFLPQRPYCPTGTLRSQLLYPSTEPGDGDDDFVWGANWSDEQLLEVLDSVDLPDLAARAGDGDPIRGINAVLDWTNTLSLGEQQRLAFGRLLVNRPRLVIMDESTSALDVAAEKKMYALLKGRLRSNTGEPVTYFSVGHRPTLMAYHDLKLILRDGSGFASFIPQNASSSADQELILRSLQR